MTTAELLALFRRETRDDVAPYLWSDEDVYGYMSAAQEMFCRLTDGINDSTSAIASVSVTAGEPVVTLDPSILRLRQVRLASTNRPLTLLNPEDVELGGFGANDYGLSYRRGIDLTAAGTPQYLVIGMDDDQGRLVPIPTADDTLQLVVQRMPSGPIEDDSDDLEVPDRHHRYLVLWMQHLAHNRQDAEAYDRGRSQEFEAAFREYCFQAKHEQELRQHKYRTMSYGGL